MFRIKLDEIGNVLEADDRGYLRVQTSDGKILPLPLTVVTVTLNDRQPGINVEIRGFISRYDLE